MKKSPCLVLLCSLLFSFVSLQAQTRSTDVQQPQAAAIPLNNNDILEILKGGLSADIVVAKIKASLCDFDTSAAALSQLKSAGVPDAIILAMVQAPSANPPQHGNDVNSSRKSDSAPKRTDELAVLFKKLQNCVVTVWSEIGQGTGFIADSKGLILTNQHVVGPSEIISVQFDEKRKVRAVLLASDTEKDIAVLWANTNAFSGALVAPVMASGSQEEPVVEGERVFTIGSPLSQRKILTTGIVSKVEARAIISDINVNPGNSGGPLFNSLGFVVGLTTFNEQRRSGPGISGIVRIEEATATLDRAKAKLVTAPSLPDARLLPVEPTDTFPLDALKAAALEEKFDTKPYLFGAGDYDVALITPVLKYHFGMQSQVAAAKEKSKRTKNKAGAAAESFRPLEDLKNWEEYAGEYQPVVQIEANPKLRETFMSAFGRGLAGGRYAGPAKMRFKTDFYKMRLLCGNKEIEPIQPSKVADVVDVHNPFVNVTDATYVGFYSYPPDSVSPACGQVALELYSEKEPNKPTVKILDPKSVNRIWSDFESYRKATTTEKSDHH